MQDQPFVAALSAAPSYALGEPVTVGLEVRNDGQQAVQFLAWGTPFEGDVAADFLIVRRDGEPVEYDGQLVNRGDPLDEDYVFLAPGQSISAEVDISRLYAIDRPGDYEITLNPRLYDAFVVAGDTKAAPRTRDTLEAHDIDGSTARFTVTPDGEPKLTLGASVRQAEGPEVRSAEDKAAAPNFNGGTPAQQAVTRRAHDKAQQECGLCLQQLTSATPSTNALFIEWFGVFDQGRYDTVTSHFEDMRDFLANIQVTYDLTGTGCRPNVYAYTFKGSRTVWLCALYHSAPESGTDSKFGTLIHEWSHAVCRTDDIAYGVNACRALAKDDPARAVVNADSHEYFAEHR
ncbi:M35 family metallo-endopeptidase [Geodermatophilus sp. SYSU D00779]